MRFASFDFRNGSSLFTNFTFSRTNRFQLCPLVRSPLTLSCSVVFLLVFGGIIKTRQVANHHRSKLQFNSMNAKVRSDCSHLNHHMFIDNFASLLCSNGKWLVLEPQLLYRILHKWHNNNSTNQFLFMKSQLSHSLNYVCVWVQRQQITSTLFCSCISFVYHLFIARSPFLLPFSVREYFLNDPFEVIC